MQLSTFIPPLSLLLASSSSFVSAHFQLNYPTSLGFDEDKETGYPCGGSPIQFDSADTLIAVDSFPVALLSTHPKGKFTYRATLSQKEPFQWVELLAVDETGLGNFCLPNLRAPANYSGSSGLVQVIGEVGDGTLYQCAAVRFVSGSTGSIDSNVCKNSTVTAIVTSTGNATSTNTTSGTSTGTATTSSATATKSGSASGGLLGNAFVVGLGAAFVGGLAVF